MVSKCMIVHLYTTICGKLRPQRRSEMTNRRRGAASCTHPAARLCARKRPAATTEKRAMGSRLLIPVIMCGGAGTRLWPVSRESMPKQFVPLVGERSTFQQVLGRIGDQAIFDRPIVITNSDFRFIVAEQMRACAIEGDIVLEPIRRESAMAIGVAAVLAGARDPASTVIVLA